MQINKKLLNELEGDSVKGSSWLLILIIFILTVLFWWAYITELDVVVRGQGKTVSKGKNQMVQSAESGVIVQNFIEEGDTIEIGDVLFEIDLVDLNGQIDQVSERISLLQVKKDRLIAESKGEQYKISLDYQGKKLGLGVQVSQVSQNFQR